MQTFKNLGLPDPILAAISDLGYEEPSPIQEKSIPVLMDGKDLLARAPTGTGKTAAFALPILAHLDLSLEQPQALVLAPTRELAIQVAESFKSCAKHMPQFHVLPIYGGQDFRPQLKALKRGVHVVVGTPGRIMDQLRRGSLSLAKIKMIVLDEADEMLKMGFIDDVQWILQQIPHEHQTALFSATIPHSIQAIADKYLKQPVKIQIKSQQTTVNTIEQNYMSVANNHKLEALTRFLEIEDTDGIIIFTRTKTTSSEIADKLEARGYAAAAINGDMKQEARERVIQRIKNGELDIVVATDVAARGIDVDRISHVINYDIPYDTESYIHRIGRTGRAGRSGKALLFITPRERRMLKAIENAVGLTLKPITPPSLQQLNQKRLESFIAQVLQVIRDEDLDNYKELIEELINKNETSINDVAAALAFLSQKEKLFQGSNEKQDVLLMTSQSESSYSRSQGSRRGREEGGREQGRRDQGRREPDSNMTPCRIEVGRKHRVQPGDIVGAIANEAGISRKDIGRIEILENYSIVDLASDLVPNIMKATRNCYIRNQTIQLTPINNKSVRSSKPPFAERDGARKNRRRDDF